MSSKNNSTGEQLTLKRKPIVGELVNDRELAKETKPKAWTENVKLHLQGNLFASGVAGIGFFGIIYSSLYQPPFFLALTLFCLMVVAYSFVLFLKNLTLTENKGLSSFEEAKICQIAIRVLFANMFVVLSAIPLVVILAIAGSFFELNSSLGEISFGFSGLFRCLLAWLICTELFFLIFSLYDTFRYSSVKLRFQLEAMKQKANEGL